MVHITAPSSTLHSVEQCTSILCPTTPYYNQTQRFEEGLQTDADLEELGVEGILDQNKGMAFVKTKEQGERERRKRKEPISL